MSYESRHIELGSIISSDERHLNVSTTSGRSKSNGTNCIVLPVRVSNQPGNFRTVHDSLHLEEETIRRRREQLRQRQQNLISAKILHEDELLSEFDMGAKIAHAR